MDTFPEKIINQENDISNNLSQTEEGKSNEDISQSEEKKSDENSSQTQEEITNEKDIPQTLIEKNNTNIDVRDSINTNVKNDLRKYHKEVINNIEEINYHIPDEREIVSFIDRTKDEKEKIKEVFVEPDDYHLAFTNFQNTDQRIVVISGNENSGRFATAVNFGLDIQNNDENTKKIVSCRIDTAQLLDIVFDKQFVEGTICIYPNISKDKAIQKRHFDEINLIQEKLREKNAYLIITVLDDDEVMANLSVSNLNILNISYEKTNFQDVIERHLAYYSNKYKWSLEMNRYLKPAITRLISKESDIVVNPVLIDRLLSKLISYNWTTESEDEPNKQKEITDLIEQIANESFLFPNNQIINPNTWFSQLKENQRVFVLLARLFEQMDFDDFEQLYFEVVTFLRNDRYPLIDPRRIGIFELVASTKIIITDNQIEINPVFYEEIDRQIENRYYLLSSLLELFTKHIVEKKGKQHAQLRRVYGIAIGWISLHQQSYLNKNLSYLADSQSNDVAAVPGYALLEVCLKNKENCYMALEIVEGWSRGGKSSFLWAAIASIWRLYNGFTSKQDTYLDEIQQLWEILKFIGNEVSINEKVASLPKKEYFILIDAFLYAIYKMAQNNLKDVIETLIHWINGHDEDIRLIACLSAINLFYDVEVTKRMIINSNKFYLLQLIEPLLEYPDLLVEGNTISYILQWLKCDGWETKHRDVTDFFIELSDRLSSRKRNILKNLFLNIWFSDLTTSMNTRKVGIDILQHIYMLQGSPILFDDNAVIYLLIDRSIKQLNVEQNFDPTILFDLLSIRGNIYASFLGGLDRIDRQEIETSIYYGYTEPLPALICGSLEHLLQKNHAPYLIVNYGSREIIDVNDLESFETKDIFLYLYPPPENTKTENDKKNGINIFKNGYLDFDSIDDRVDTILISQMQKLSPDVLQEQIKLFWPDIQLDAPENLINKINLISYNKENSFPSEKTEVFHIITSCIWLFKTKPHLLLSQLINWLSEKNEQLDKSILVGLLRLLLKMAIQAPPKDWQVYYAELIGLLDDLYPLSNDLLTIYEIHNYLFRLLEEVDCVKFERQYIYYENCSLDYVALLKTIHSREAKALSLWIQVFNENMQDTNNKARLYQKFTFLLRAVQAADIPDLKEGQKYGLFLIQSGRKNAKEWPELANVLNWIQHMNDYQEHQNILPIVFQMGQMNPLLAGDTIPLEEIIDWNENYDLPLLTAPIMDRFSQEEIQFIFLISEKSIIDIDDWIDLSWQSKKIPVISWSHNDSTLENNIPGVMHFSGKGKSIGDKLKLWGTKDPE